MTAIEEGRQYLIKMKEHRDCCGTQVVRKLIEEIESLQKFEVTDKMILAALEKTRPHNYKDDPWVVPRPSHNPRYEIFMEMKVALQAALEVSPESICKNFGFTVGDRVNHVLIGQGYVVQIDEEGVRVIFEGGAPTGLYDEKWFNKFPTSLTKL